MDISDVQWAETRAAFKRAGDRFADLLAVVPDPEARATKSWSVAQTAAHMASLAWVYTTLVDPDKRAGRDTALDAQLDSTNVDNVRDLNDLLLRRYLLDRNLADIGVRLREDVDTVLRVTEGADPAGPIGWLGGSTVPRAGLLAHLTNELLIHGWDISRAARLPWTIPPRDAALFLELFLVGVTSYGYGVLLEGTPTPPPRRIAVQFRSRHMKPATMVLDGTVPGGLVTVEEPRPDNDVVLLFHPPTLNLMLFGRVSQLRAVATGKVFVRGRRPWLLPAFMRTVHMPNN